jgi:TolA-binding protein
MKCVYNPVEKAKLIIISWFLLLGIKIYFCTSNQKTMADKKHLDEKGDQRLENIEETLTRTEQFIFNNQKNISVVVFVVVIGIIAYFAYNKYYMAPKSMEASTQMFNAQRYFEQDSIEKALYGDGNNLGFIDISGKYGSTKQGNLAKYYAGICFLKKKDFKQAIDYLEDFSGDDHLIGPMATGAIGDAQLELGDQKKAAAFYLEAANQDGNGFTAPLFLMKAGNVYELMGKYDDAISTYERVKTNFVKSKEARNIDKYIARATTAKKNK